MPAVTWQQDMVQIWFRYPQDIGLQTKACRQFADIHVWVHDEVPVDAGNLTVMQRCNDTMLQEV
jgi:hypothetical protein